MEHEEQSSTYNNPENREIHDIIMHQDSIESQIQEEVQIQYYTQLSTEQEQQRKDVVSLGRKRNQAVIVMIALCQGFATFANLSINFFFKDELQLDPAQLSLFNSIINFVWILKPIFGFICDSYPIFGSHRKAYLIIFSILQTFCWIWLGLWVDSLGQAIVVKTLINVSASFVNVIGEALMVQASQISDDQQKEADRERMGDSVSSQGDVQYDNKTTATNVSIFLSLTSFSTLLSQYLGGQLLNVFTTQQIFLITSIFPVITLIAGFVAFEYKERSYSNAEIRRNRQRRCETALKNLRKVKEFLKLPFIYRPIIFIFLVVLSPGVDDAMFYYESNILMFTTTQFAYINVLSSLANIIGVWTYRFFFRETPFRVMLIITTICFAFVQLAKLMVVLPNTGGPVLCEQYLNLSPVHYYYITSWFYSFVNELHLMPLMVLACKMCPKRAEASFYAMVMAIINLGYLVSYQLGGLLTFALGITSTVFFNLWILIVIAVVFPLLTLFFLLIVPTSINVNEQIETYLKQKEEEKKSDSKQKERKSSHVLIKKNIREDRINEKLLADKDSD